MMSGQATIEMAVRATPWAPIDFLEKPISTDKLLLTVDNAMRLAHLETENRELKKRLGRHQIVWASQAMREVMEQVERVAASETRVCIRGETGTGKELIARTLHEKSPRRDGPFISLNCAAIPSELMESELFGHEKGSFTGRCRRGISANSSRPTAARFFWTRLAICRWPCRRSCLRVLEEGEIERVGGDRPFAVDVRVVVATHRNLEEQVRQGGVSRGPVSSRASFSRLCCRLCASAGKIFARWRNISCGSLPEQNNWKPRDFSPEALEWLAGYSWPGNVRELRNVIERILLLSGRRYYRRGDVERALPRAAPLAAGHATGGGAVSELSTGALASAWRLLNAKPCSPNSRNTTIT